MYFVYNSLCIYQAFFVSCTSEDVHDARVFANNQKKNPTEKATNENKAEKTE